MAYRRTPKVEARLARNRERIIAAAQQCVAEGGYAAASIPAIAARSGLSTGVLYRYFPSKWVLLDEVFQQASQREIQACEQAAEAMPGPAGQRLAHVIRVFVTRALHGRRLAYALLFEPVDERIQSDRQRFRAPYQALFARVIADGVAQGELPAQDALRSATAMVGAIAESLSAPLTQNTPADPAFLSDLIRFCQRAVGCPEGTPTRAPAPPAPRHTTPSNTAALATTPDGTPIT